MATRILLRTNLGRIVASVVGMILLLGSWTSASHAQPGTPVPPADAGVPQPIEIADDGDAGSNEGGTDGPLLIAEDPADVVVIEQPPPPPPPPPPPASAATSSAAGTASARPGRVVRG